MSIFGRRNPKLGSKTYGILPGRGMGYGLLWTYGLWGAIPRPPKWWTQKCMGFQRLWVMASMGYEGADYSRLRKYCGENDVPSKHASFFDTCYVSKGSYTLSFTPWKKTFKVVLVCCSHDPSPHPPSIFGSFSGSFASICSCPSGVPITSLLFLAAFEHVLHLFVFITSLALPSGSLSASNSNLKKGNHFIFRNVLWFHQSFVAQCWICLNSTRHFMFSCSLKK